MNPRASWLCALVLMGLFSSCGLGPSKQPRVRALEELPARYREVWQAFRKDDPSWPVLREEVAADEALRAFVVDNLVREMLLAYGQVDHAQEVRGATRHFRRTRAELLRFPEQAAVVLSELLAVGNGTATFLAGDLLQEMGAGAVPAVLSGLESKSIQGRQWCARLLGDLPHAGAEEERVWLALARHLAADEDWLTRAQCARALGARGTLARSTARARRLLVGALADGDPAVRRSAAAALGQLADPAAVPALVDYLERTVSEGSLREGLAAETALSQLTGLEGGRGVEGWRAWLRSQGS